MSFGANTSSGYTDSLIEKVIQKNRCKLPNNTNTVRCCRVPGYQSVATQPVATQPVAKYPSMVLAAVQDCSSPTPAQFALYPKVAVSSSVLTQNKINPVTSINRFSQYQRYDPPAPCQPLPASANMAGISKPSILGCNTISPWDT